MKKIQRILAALLALAIVLAFSPMHALAAESTDTETQPSETVEPTEQGDGGNVDVVVLTPQSAGLTPSAVTATAAPAPTPAPTAGDEPPQETLIVDRPEQSPEVIVTEGDPEGTKNTDPDQTLPDGYDLLLGEDGVFRVTYTIPEGTSVEELDIDLNKAMDIARTYQGTTDSTWLMPGDVRVIEFFIQSETGHTYKYQDGSFVLTTGDLGTNQTTDENGNTITEEPKEGDAVGFDGQVLTENQPGATPEDQARLYDKFYKQIMSVVYGETKEDIDEVTGGQSGVVQTTVKYTYTVIDADTGKTFENCVPAFEAGNYYKELVESKGLPKDTLICIKDETVDYGFKTADGEYATAANSQDCLKETYISEMPHYKNVSWYGQKLADQVADYMDKNNIAWQEANAFFNNMLGQGIALDDAVSAFMAFNLDIERMNNPYVITEWDWSNTITLERIDGEAAIEKVDEAGKTITADETSFLIWQYKDETDDTGAVTTKKQFLTETEQDGKKSYGWVDYDESKKTLDYTIDTTGGKLDITYAMLEDMIYYLQEAIAPQGYELDATVYVICDDEEYDAAVEALATQGDSTEATKISHAGAIDSGKKLEIKVINKKNVTPPDPTDPDPTEPVPTEPVPTEPEPTEPEPTEPEPTVPAPTQPKPDPGRATEELEETGVPLAASGEAWALYNFALMELAIFESIVMLAGYFIRSKKSDQEDLKKKGLPRLLSVLVAIGSVIAFVLTEDIHVPLILIDKWTPLMVVFALVQTALLTWSRKTYRKAEQAQETNV